MRPDAAARRTLISTRRPAAGCFEKNRNDSSGGDGCNGRRESILYTRAPVAEAAPAPRPHEAAVAHKEEKILRFAPAGLALAAAACLSPATRAENVPVVWDQRPDTGTSHPLSVSAIPEPGSSGLMGLGLAYLAFVTRRRTRA
jgi:hypothetical protein